MAPSNVQIHRVRAGGIVRHVAEDSLALVVATDHDAGTFTLERLGDPCPRGRVVVSRTALAADYVW